MSREIDIGLSTGPASTLATTSTSAKQLSQIRRCIAWASSADGEFNAVGDAAEVAQLDLVLGLARRMPIHDHVVGNVLPAERAIIPGDAVAVGVIDVQPQGRAAPADGDDAGAFLALEGLG